MAQLWFLQNNVYLKIVKLFQSSLHFKVAFLGGIEWLIEVYF